MQPYIELNAHHIGYSHVQNGLSCEDYSAAYSDDTVSIVVISDGHGDKNCFRSDRGARFACETAVNKCREFQKITDHIDDIADCDFEELVKALEADIADSWSETVLSDASAHPFSEQELSVASDQAQEAYRNGQRLEKAYGCTLIFSMCTANYWLSIQIGDGKSVAAYRDGVFIEPVPADENCVGNRSTSLCNSNAKELFRHYYSKVKPIAAFVSSDGIEESFDQAGLFNFFYSLSYWLQAEGFDIAKSKLSGLLPQISEGGSGDDVSVALMASTEDAVAKPRQTLDQIYQRVDSCESALDQCKKLLADAKHRLSVKNKECSALEQEIAKLKAELEEKEEAHKQITDEQPALLQSVEELDIKTQRASAQMEKASKYKASAERFWFAEFEKLGIPYDSSADEPQTVDILGEKPEEKEDSLPAETQETDKIPASADDANPSVSNELPFEGIDGQETEAETMDQAEGDSPAADSQAIRALALKTSSEESDEKSPKRFWPFFKQIKNKEM